MSIVSRNRLVFFHGRLAYFICSSVVYEISGIDAANYIKPIDYKTIGSIIDDILVGSIAAPSSVCSGSALTLAEPSVDNYGIAFTGKWEMSGDNFATISEYAGQSLSEDNNGWGLRYAAQSDFGTFYSNEVKIEVNLESSYVVQMWDDVLVCHNAKGLNFVSWQWYYNGSAIEGATKQYYSNPSINAGYQVEATSDDGRTYFSCPLISTNKSQTVSLKAYPNPSLAADPLKIEVVGLDQSMLENTTLAAYSTTGVQVMNLGNVSKVSEIRLPQGIYVVVLRTGNRTISTKVVRR